MAWRNTKCLRDQGDELSSCRWIGRSGHMLDLIPSGSPFGEVHQASRRVRRVRQGVQNGIVNKPGSSFTERDGFEDEKIGDPLRASGPSDGELAQIRIFNAIRVAPSDLEALIARRYGDRQTTSGCRYTANVANPDDRRSRLVLAPHVRIGVGALQEARDGPAIKHAQDAEEPASDGNAVLRTP